MRAVRFARHGKPDVLVVQQVADLSADHGEAVIRIEAASVNPSDVKNVQGLMEQTTMPRTPGRDFAGVVEAGPPDWIGAEVWGTGGDIGFTRDGSHAECILVPVASLGRKPERLDFEQAASVGVNFIAAWRGLVDGAGLKANETVLIIAASGGVGNAGVADCAPSRRSDHRHRSPGGSGRCGNRRDGAVADRRWAGHAGGGATSDRRPGCRRRTGLRRRRDVPACAGLPRPRRPAGGNERDWRP